VASPGRKNKTKTEKVKGENKSLDNLHASNLWFLYDEVVMLMLRLFDMSF